MVLDAYTNSQPANKKLELGGIEKNTSIGEFAKAGRQRALLFALRYVGEHATERLASILELGKISESRPGIILVDFSVNAFGEMNCRYIALIEDGSRKIIRLGGDNMR